MREKPPINRKKHESNKDCSTPLNCWGWMLLNLLKLLMFHSSRCTRALLILSPHRTGGERAVNVRGFEGDEVPLPGWPAMLGWLMTWNKTWHRFILPSHSPDIPMFIIHVQNPECPNTTGCVHPNCWVPGVGPLLEQKKTPRQSNGPVHIAWGRGSLLHAEVKAPIYWKCPRKWRELSLSSRIQGDMM